VRQRRDISRPGFAAEIRTAHVRRRQSHVICLPPAAATTPIRYSFIILTTNSDYSPKRNYLANVMVKACVSREVRTELLFADTVPPRDRPRSRKRVKCGHGFCVTRTIEWLHCKLQTRPLVREGAPQRQDRKFRTGRNIWSQVPQGCSIPRLTD
jgi:hypothetical protein